MKVYNGTERIEPDTVYMVNVFLRDWSHVLDCYTVFAPGGTHFIAMGRNLQRMIALCPTFDEVEALQNKNNVQRKAKNTCFAGVTNRNDVITRYREMFYQGDKQGVNTRQDFELLCQRPRTNRFGNRLKFTYKIIKSLMCDKCDKSACVYQALKMFYNNDSKCIKEVDYAVSKNG
ncbi:lef-2 [Spodoptera litura granulovirus]|uniref:Lef-2 n=1 Tax=Spodoptera litura granulovirus TaxID=359919 RepID=A5IZN4_9BBAC|nr:lef-2 [Spodoptera litura granulovirus]ABQ51975.1 lef-2 [Spodoptera litura granulovirus]